MFLLPERKNGKKLVSIIQPASNNLSSQKKIWKGQFHFASQKQIAKMIIKSEPNPW